MDAKEASFALLAALRLLQERSFCHIFVNKLITMQQKNCKKIIVLEYVNTALSYDYLAQLSVVTFIPILEFII